MKYEIYYILEKEELKYTARSFSEKENFVREFKNIGAKISRIKEVKEHEVIDKKLKKEIWNNHWNFDERIKGKLIEEIKNE